MGKRSRKRSSGPVRAPHPAGDGERRPAPARPPARKGRVDRFIERADERPKAPWHPVPLIELSVLAGIVLIVIGLVNRDDSQGRLAAVFGMALASLAGLDTAVRDHFSGFRSHSALLAAMPAVLVAIALAYVEAPLAVMFFAAVGIYIVAFFAFRGTFKRRTGVGFKV